MAEPAGDGPVETLVEDARWQAVGIDALAGRVVTAALAAAGRDPRGFEIALLAADDARVAGLNREFRGKPQPTNVLSWPAFAGAVAEPASGEPVFLGDIALAYETCSAEADSAGLALADHAAHLVAHGVLHLLGHDHGDDTEAERMEALETKILASLGIANPYSA